MRAGGEQAAQSANGPLPPQSTRGPLTAASRRDIASPSTSLECSSAAATGSARRPRPDATPPTTTRTRLTSTATSFGIFTSSRTAGSSVNFDGYEKFQEANRRTGGRNARLRMKLDCVKERLVRRTLGAEEVSLQVLARGAKRGLMAVLVPGVLGTGGRPTRLISGGALTREGSDPGAHQGDLGLEAVHMVSVHVVKYQMLTFRE